uniref:Uncharacterized protein n=1 Tax=Ascaris lumbricoides TaxID=6252 RepID=A0A0M3HNL8_ASCLU
MISDLLRGADAPPSASQRSRDADATSTTRREVPSNTNNTCSTDVTAAQTISKKQLSAHRFSVTDILSPFDNIGTANPF